MYQDAKQDAYYAGDFEAIERIIDAELYGGPSPVFEDRPKRQNGPIVYIDPGSGAVEYARPFVKGLSKDEAMPVLRRLLAGDLHDPADRRVKLCDWCGYPWRDDSLRNTKRTCCAECKTDLKTHQRRIQRANRDLLSGRKKRTNKRDEYYQWWHEYPLWATDEKTMTRYWSRQEKSGYKDGLIDFISAKNEIYGPGNRKVKAKIAPENGTTIEDERMGREFYRQTRRIMRGF